MSMSDSQYNEYLARMREIVNYGTKEGLIDFYRMMLSQTGDRENVRRMDSLNNSRWYIDIDRL